jgi:monofunctional biosynthetic peptidoglycan transglycosylase
VDIEQLRESIQVNWEQGRAVRGASTITQQLAKNLYLSPSRSPLRKLRELIIARRLEAALPKARIFEIYLNVIEWGDGIWGAEGAARAYFRVPASALSREQSALLAGAIINPRVLNPARPTPRLIRRQRIVLSRMGDVTPPVPAPVAPPRAEPVEEGGEPPPEPEPPGAPSADDPAPADAIPAEPPATPVELPPLQPS